MAGLTSSEDLVLQMTFAARSGRQGWTECSLFWGLEGVLRVCSGPHAVPDAEAAKAVERFVLWPRPHLPPPVIQNGPSVLGDFR